MIEEIDFMVADNNDLDEVYSFHYRYFKDLRNRYTWEWEYGKENSFTSILILGKLKGKLIATQGIMCILLIVNSKNVISGKNESLLIDKELRGKGLNTVFYKYSLEKYKNIVPFIWGFSRKAVIPLSKAGFMVFSRPLNIAILNLKTKHITKIISQHNINKFYKVLTYIGVFVVSIYTNLMFMLNTMLTKKTSYTITITDELYNEVDIELLYKRIEKKYNPMIYLKWEKKHIDWRINKSPKKIKTQYFYHNLVLKGYYFIAEYESYYLLLDFTFEDKLIGKIMMYSLNRFIKQHDDKIYIYYGNKYNRLNKKIFNLLKKDGFILIKGQNDFVLNIFDFNDRDCLINIKNWYINGAWFEGN